MSWFRKKRPPDALAILSGAEWKCAGCDDVHRGMFDLAAFAPDPWSGPITYEPNSALTLEGDFLSEDFCVLGGRNFLVRCVLDFPVEGLEQSFGFGCWGTLSKENFELYVSRFDDADYAGLGPWTSWLCNDVMQLVGSEPIGCHMFPQLDRQRPVLKVMDDEHPIALMQAQGIAPEDVLGIYRMNGHPLT